MNPELRYECALSAALEILNAFDAALASAKNDRMALVIFTIFDAMARYEERKGARHVEFSVN